MSYHVAPYLQRIRWIDGTLGYCRKCDDTVPLVATIDRMLECPRSHKQHPVNLIVSGQVNT